MTIVIAIVNHYHDSHDYRSYCDSPTHHTHQTDKCPENSSTISLLMFGKSYVVYEICFTVSQQLLISLIFSVFVEECVLRLWRERRNNPHWVPVVDRCTVCNNETFKWDYVGKCRPADFTELLHIIEEPLCAGLCPSLVEWHCQNMLM